ncbi:hypothetical protein A2291_00680 [candidate division WOR-1 bacterium RIFOXYB2_FULL_42_35]|uniref:Uncharacterized protein n=1 Tax=candidate division WOR-1 bacterium RIFOXYC2_FULL_41_25 TaxID=1802586 RepID=A0A1F4TRJ2_UNCSA|nr:MAG: hypothetical protein A2247_07910 [candidate division WOR-1 bacterium RIFOXYA2_FULL_41_14]OGC25742.1 MAG: hypothetical protein A2291_00680 [candidate division WOR-1 bacterium RIFOXYB2_FULL_42_35]OGC35345.1 MAG: hypothetical protein A2462_06980 [candidate division WOR-1 bacterium RIFOXYC2_FULL_41_25]OGC43526.1 MAG: hypothetical protein A2548_06445 [candidate division WOR-1 bacterium RIFOXYD2_FULL_41_8]
MKTRLWFFVKKYYKEMLAALFAIVSIIIAYFYKDRPIYLWGSILIVFFSLLIYIYLKRKEKDFYFIELINRKDKDEWIGRGEFDYDRNEQCFAITNSAEGYIFSKCLNWSNYKMEFEFKIANSCMGIILRSISLSNYVMLQISPKGVNPHICIMGGWKRWNHNDENISLTFSEELSLDRWYKGVVLCDKENIKVRISDDLHKKLFDREWRIPRGIISVYYENLPGEVDAAKKWMNYPINLEYGTFGFRNCGNEKAFLKNVVVEKI